jgi:hypothetical protein
MTSWHWPHMSPVLVLGVRLRDPELPVVSNAEMVMAKETHMIDNCQTPSLAQSPRRV